MNASMNAASEDDIRATFPDEVNAVIDRYGWSLGMVPKPLRTKDVCAHFVHRSHFNLAYCPFYCRNDEVCADAVSQNGCALFYVREGSLTKPLCLKAVTQTPMALMYVPDRLRDADVCEAALKNGGADDEFIWKFVPPFVLPELERRGIVRPPFEDRDIILF